MSGPRPCRPSPRAWRGTPRRAEPLIRPLALPHPGLPPLLADSLADTQSMIRRLWKEWRNGGNRFALPGEALFGAFQGETLVGVCGLNRDPYGGRVEAGAEVGRVRHLYVARAQRRQGIGRALLEAVIAAAQGHFTRLELWTLSPEAAALFRALAFEEVGDDLFATHRRLLRSASASSRSSRPPSPRACGG